MEVIHHKHTEVPIQEIAAAILQEKHLSRVRKKVLLLNGLGVALMLMHSKYQGEFTPHNHQRIAEGASGTHRYHGLDPSWLEGNAYQRFVAMYANFHDGNDGDMRGEWSAICGGKEKTWWNRFRWNHRNPANGLRETDMFSVVPAECDTVEIWGYDFDLDNKPVVDQGWWFIKAQSKGRTYYSYRRVAFHDDGTWAHNASIGFKLKPSHFGPDAETEAKGFTSRITPIFLDKE